MIGENPYLFYALLAVTGLICGWQVVRSLVIPSERLGLPLIFCLAFSYFYVLQAYLAFETLDYVLPIWMYEYGQFLALLALVAFLGGWRVGRRPTPRRMVHPERYSGLVVYICAMGGLLIAAATSRIYIESSQYGETSAYVYLGFNLSYPGVLLCLQTAARDRSYRNPLLLIPPIALLAYVLFPFIVNVRRGPMFPMAVVLLYGYTLARGTKMNPVVLLGGLCGVGFVMLMFVTIRDYSSGVEGASWSSERVQNVSASGVLFGKAKEVSDNEYIYHCAVSSTIWLTGVTDYGTGYITLSTHFIPRTLWPEKPALGQGFLGGEAYTMAPKYTGVGLSYGASSGGVCETYGHLGPFAFGFWYLFGWWGGRLYTRCLTQRRPVDQAMYIAIAASSHWLISQGVAAAFVPGMVYFLFPMAVYALAAYRMDLGGRR